MNNRGYYLAQSKKKKVTKHQNNATFDPWGQQGTTNTYTPSPSMTGANSPAATTMVSPTQSSADISSLSSPGATAGQATVPKSASMTPSGGGGAEAPAATGSVAGGIATGAANMAGSMMQDYGQSQTNRKKEVRGEAWKDAGKYGAAGAGLGATIGTAIVPGVGTAIGAGIGFLAGGIAGLFTGRARGKRMQRNRVALHQMRMDKKLEAEKGASLTAREDALISQNLKSGKYRVGGILKYKPLSQKQKDLYTDYFNTKDQREEYRIQKAKEGFALPDLANKPIFKKIEDIVAKKPTVPVFKKGGKVEFKAKKVVPIFRRGGHLEVLKENVILDGPSHDEENNTGVKGDKGLPVVKDGVKVAEIESLELVLNKRASEELMQLYKEYQEEKDPKKKEKIKEEIGKLLAEELEENTYDYSNLLED